MRKGFDVRVGDGDQENDAARDGQDNIANVGEEVLIHPCAAGAVEKQPDFISEQAHADSDQGAGDENPFHVMVVIQNSQNTA